MDIVNKLINDSILSEKDATAISEFELKKPMSLHWELKTILYLGILLIISGISILVYQNIDTIGHQAILGSILLACTACFYFSFKKRKLYTHEQVSYASPLTDYAVLFGSLLLGVFLAYMHYQYGLFGYHYGLATFIPAIFYFVVAYLFDHKGVLSLGITGLTASVGISTTPLQVFESNDFSKIETIIAAGCVGLCLALFSWYSDSKNIKKHFSFTYNNFAINIIFITTLAALFDKDMKLLSFLVLAATTYYYFIYAVKNQSFLFLLLAVVYGYIGFTYSIFTLANEISYSLTEALAMIYFLASCTGIVLFFVYYKRILKIKK